MKSDDEVHGLATGMLIIMFVYNLTMLIFLPKVFFLLHLYLFLVTYSLYYNSAPLVGNSFGLISTILAVV